MAFNLNQLVDNRPVEKVQQEIVYRDIFELVPSGDNFYSTENLDGLKQSIAIFGVMQPLLIEKDEQGRDCIIAGHRRHKCCKALVKDGYPELQQIPCIYRQKTEIQGDSDGTEDILDQMALIQTNSFREKTDWEKMREAIRMEELIKQLRAKRPDIQGRTRDILNDMIKISTGKMGRYAAIANNLCKQLMQEFKEDRIKISVAYEASRLTEEQQKLACEEFEASGTLSLEDIEKIKSLDEQIEGQMNIEDMMYPSLDEQIKGLFESLRDNVKKYVTTCDQNMLTYFLASFYNGIKVNTQQLNYRGAKGGITFICEDGKEETFLTWQNLAFKLIEKFGKKQKPVKMADITQPEPEKKQVTKCIHREGYTCTLSEAQKAAAGDGIDCSQKCCWNCPEHGTCGYECNSSAHRPDTEKTDQENPQGLKNSDEMRHPGEKCITGMSGSGVCGAAAYCTSEHRCCKDCEDKCNSYCGWLETETESEETLRNTDVSEDLDVSKSDTSETDQEPNENSIIERMLMKEQDWLSQFQAAEMPEEQIQKKKILVEALTMLMESRKEKEEPDQPELPMLKNNDQRKEWLRNYKSWGLWYSDEKIGAKYYKYDFENGSRLIVEEYEPEPQKNSWWVSSQSESYYMHLVGGPEPDRKDGIPKWTYHSKYNKFPNSESELIEFLKELQKK